MATRVSYAAAVSLTLLCSVVATGPAAALELTGNASNPHRIRIPVVGTASPYPSKLLVDGLRGKITSVTVTLNGLIHTCPDDLNVMLVAPAGQQVMLMSDVGDCGQTEQATLTFSATSHAIVPPRSLYASGTYLPTDWIEDNHEFPGAPPGTPLTDLRVFNGPAEAQNGKWRLYMVDKGPGNPGALTRGWTLSINTQLFTSCQDEADTDASFRGPKKLALCQQICEVDQSPARLDALIRKYVSRYHEPPPCD